MKALSPREEGIVSASIFAARGDQKALKSALEIGLDHGVTINEFKEILTQIYAYAGFPRSLNALATLMSVVQERKTRGIQDEEGPLPGPLPEEESLDFGTRNQTELCGAPVTGPLFDFAPAIDEYLKSHLFGDIFARDNIDWKTREMATIGTLGAMNGVEPQLAAHIEIGKKNGVTNEQIEEILAIAGRTPEIAPNPSPFPIGVENSGFAQYFHGKSFLAPLTTDKDLNVPIYNVTFEPGCRNNWHRHSEGQILLAVGGVGYYQERGKDARRLLPGDVVEIRPDVDHWHGAAPDRWFSHLAIEVAPKTNQTTWLEPVDDEEYLKATAHNEVPKQSPLVRVAKITVDAGCLEEYKARLQKGIDAAQTKEPGVLKIYAIQEKKDPTRFTLMEIYADEEAYRSHLTSPHFLEYKEETIEMIKELELIDVDPLLLDQKFD